MVLASRLNHRDVPPWVIGKLRSMADFLSGVRHPDGEIPLIGDSAFGIARATSDLLAAAMVILDAPGAWPGTRPDLYCAIMAPQAFQAEPATSTPQQESGSWPDTGYCALSGPGGTDWLIVDTKPMGPPNIPAHGHCSLSSYELSIGGERVIVDSGVAEYQPGPWRLFWRSTRAHNTVSVDGAEQSEIWAAFRVGDRVRVLESNCASDREALLYQGADSGFVGLSVRHTRFIAALPGRIWIVLDELDGAGEHIVESFIHLHPNVACELNGTTAALYTRSLRMRIHPYRAGDPAAPLQMRCVQGQLDPIQGWYAPQFGLRQPNPVLVLSCRMALPGRIGYLLAPEDREITSWDLTSARSVAGLKVRAAVGSPQGDVVSEFLADRAAQLP